MDLQTGSDKTFIERVLITIGFVILSFLLLALLYYTFDVILVVFGAVLLAIFLRGIADLLGRFIKLGNAWMVLISAALLLLVFAGAIAGLAPSVADQVEHLRVEIPKSLDAARSYILQFSWGRALLQRLPNTQEIWQTISSGAVLARVGGIFSTTLGAVGNFLIVVLLAIYFAIEPKFYVVGFAKLFPVPKRERVLEVLASIGETLRWWLIGKVGSMLFIGVLTWIALSILGVPLALTLGLIAGLFSFIPNFGPILAALPAILIAFVESPTMALYVIAIYVGVQIIEGNVVTPLIERETVELPPGLTVVSQLVLAVLVGGLGLVLATPLLAVIMVVIQMVYIEDVLGDHETDVEKKMPEAETKEAAAELQDESEPPAVAGS